MYIAVLNKSDHRTVSDQTQRWPASAGRITAGMELVIVDDAGEPVPVGTTGEVSRATIAGYYDNPEHTAVGFANGFWKSGDLGHVDKDGYLFIVDCKRDIIITGGFNVYAVEVEAALSEHPAVLMCAVVGVPQRNGAQRCMPRSSSVKA